VNDGDDTTARSVEVTHPERVLFPDAGVTKGDVVEYYRRIADLLLPHVAGRPLVVQRFPEGIDKAGFYQKNTPRHAPDWLDTVELRTAEGGSTRYPVVDDEAGLAFLANYGSVVLHTLLNTADEPERPVEVIWDLDPSSDDLDVVRDAARHLRDVLDGLGLRPRVKSSGSRGLHVLVDVVGPADYDLTRAFALAVAEQVVAREPDRFTVAFHKKERRGRLFIDVLRNGRAAHAVAPYSLRARPEAPVAAPLSWDEALSADFHPRRITIANVFRRLGQIDDPWLSRRPPDVALIDLVDDH
jgi:bifunctional non-homologous end joining protein LigD